LIDIHSPLRWYGTLRDEPATLPWGTSYEIADTLDYQDHSVPVSGGLRLTNSPHSEESPPKDLHAGDELAAVVQARLPQMFRDEGVFDRRTYLRSQGVELTAALRSSPLIELEAAGKPSPHTVLARVRRRLRESLTDLLPGAANEAAVLRAMLLGGSQLSGSIRIRKTFKTPECFTCWLLWVCTATLPLWSKVPTVLRAALMTLIVVLALVFLRRVTR
jgi:predicted membrane metal-binding protein